MRQIVATVSAALVGAAALCAIASPSFAAKAKAAVIHCPVTGAVIASPKAAYNSEVYKGKTYYFCCAGCKPLFDKNPAKYIKTSAAPMKSAKKAKG